MDIFLVAARIFIAAFLGALIGTEREKKNKAAGFRTHIIVSVGACLIMLIAIDGASELADADNWEPTRLVGQVVSGIGFLGAGTILQKRTGFRGLLQLQLYGCLQESDLQWESDITKERSLQL